MRVCGKIYFHINLCLVNTRLYFSCLLNTANIRAMFIFAISIKLINTNSYTFCVHIANPYTYSVIFAKPNNRHYTYMEIRLKELCQLKGVTQKELSAQLGVSEMTLSRT